MPMPTPQQAAANWSRGMSSSTEKWKQGVQAVQDSPTEKAANRADAYAAGVQRAVADGSYQRGLRAVSLQQWKNQTLTLGATRIAGGAAAAVPKMEAFMTNWLPFIGQVVASLPPRGDLQTNINRAVTVMNKAAEYSK